MIAEEASQIAAWITIDQLLGGEIAEEAIAFVDQPREVPHDERPHRPDQKIKNGVDQSRL